MEKFRKQRIVFLLSHPIQYFSPLFHFLAEDKEIDLLVLYCSDENVEGYTDQGFGVKVKWDIPLLEGYKYKFLKNNSWKPSIFNGFMGLVNFQVIKILSKEKESLFIVHGWNYFTHVLALLVAKFFNIKTGIRGDNPLILENIKSKKKIFIKKILLKYFLFKFIDYFFYVGQQNKSYYKYYGVNDKKLFFCPHAVDNSRFEQEYKNNLSNKNSIKKEIGLPADSVVIISVGKLIPLKRHIDLIQAYSKLENENTALIIVGDGPLKNTLLDVIEQKRIKNVHFLGFVNQSNLYKYYLISDIFVLPSESETWGLSVNEAMNFRLPIVVSDLVGCGDDLVKDGYNGFRFKVGNIEELYIKIKSIIEVESMIKIFGNHSGDLIKNYSYNQIKDSLKGFIR